jgi:DNA-binding MarR family transcriptional regulator
MDTAHSSEELVLGLMEASRELERRLTTSLSNIKGISFSEYQLLAALASMHEASATRVDLARQVGLTPSGVTRALQPLEKRKIIKTKRDARDARRSLAALTPAGAELLADARLVVADVIGSQEALEGLSSARREDLSGFFKQLARG